MSPRTSDHAEFRVPANGALEPDLMLAILAAHAIPGIDAVDPATAGHRRPVRLDSGPRVVGLRFERDAVIVGSGPLTAVEQSELAGLVRRWFSLDTDLGPANALLSGDPVLGPLVARRPALRPVGYPDAFEAAATTVLGQQVSVAAMRTFAGRLVAGWAGEPVSGLRLFPAADVVARIPEAELRAAVGLTGARTRTLLAVAAAWAAAGTGEPGDFPLSRDELLAIPGIGPWSADYLAVRARLDPDAFTPGDLVLRRALGGITAREAEARAEAWRPHRAHALFHLWSEVAYGR